MPVKLKHRYKRAPDGDLICQACGALVELSNAHGHRCGRAEPQRPTAEEFPCIHRGAVQRTPKCEICGSKDKDVDVHACALYGECTIYVAGLKKKQPSGAKMDVCTGCPARQAAPELVQIARAAGSPLRVGLITPVLATGGVERWWLSLCRHWIAGAAPAGGLSAAGDRLVPAGMAITDKVLTDHSTIDEAARFGPIFAAEHAPAGLRANTPLIQRFPTGVDAAAALRSQADILILWAHLNPEPLVAGFTGPIVLVAHGEGSWTSGVMRSAAPWATHLAAVSRAAAVAFPPDLRDRVSVVMNGVDLDRCAPSRARESIRHELGIEPGQLAIAYVGRYSQEKYPLAAALAASQINIAGAAPAGGLNIPGAIALYGGTTFNAHARREITTAAGGRVKFLDDPHVGNTYAAADVLVCASDREGGPLVVFEAWAAGLPVVATRTGAIPELEEQAGSRLCTSIPIRPPLPDLAAAVRQAAADFDTAARARTFAWSHLSAARMARDWEALLAGAAPAQPTLKEIKC